MTPQEKQDYIRYRLEKADETLKVAQVNGNLGFWNTCVNRLYYASFYAITALLLQNDHPTQTHKGVKTLFFQHFVKTKIITTDDGYLYTELFDKRQAGDYADLIDWAENDILPLIEPTRNLIQTVKNLIPNDQN